MKNSNYQYADIVFPQNINRLTYLIPAQFVDDIREGMAVDAPLKRKIQRGFVVALHTSLPGSLKRGKLKEITSFDPHFTYPRKLITLLKWVSDYYMSSEGLALKSLLFAQVLQSLKRPRKIPLSGIATRRRETSPYSEQIEELSQTVYQKTFRTFLFHSHSASHEISLVMDIVSMFRNIIVLVPQYHDIQRLLPFLEREARGRYCLLHGSMSKSGIHDTYRGILDNKYDIVIGTMQTVFIPMKNTSLIVVFKEHSPFYKHEETPTYNVRDIAVKRGSIEKIPVLMTSVSPSLESYYNCRKAKYSLVTDTVAGEYPRIRIINASGSHSILTPPLKKGIHRALDDNGKVLLILNRKGHSILKCADCGSMELCPECNVPFVYHSERLLKCHYCGAVRNVHDLCKSCGGSFLRFSTSGTEKVYDELETEFGKVVSIIDSEHLSSETSFSSDIIIGTDIVFRGLDHFSKFALTAILNADIHLQRPDFRAYEKFFQHVASLTEYNRKNSELFIQTFDWRNPFFDTIKRLDYALLFENEINKRKLFHYPPCYRIASLSLKNSAFRAMAPGKEPEDYEILGPLRKAPSGGRIEYLIKCRTDRSIQKYIRMASKHIAKDEKDLKIDIDPLVFS